MNNEHKSESGAAVRCSAWLGHVNECKLDDFIRWRRQHDDHDKAGNISGSQAHGVNSGNIEKSPQMAAQLLASGCKLKRYRLGGVTITTRADETPLHKQIGQALKFLLRCVISHKRAKWPNDPSSAARRTGRDDCNRDAQAGFAAAHG